MNRNALIAATLIVFAGCSQSAPPATVEAPGTITAASTADARAAQPCSEPTGYQPLPAKLALEVRYHLRADRIYTNKNDQGRRRVVLEFLDGDIDSTLASVEDAMTAAGFVARPRKDQPNGNIVIPYVRKDYGNITVVANPSAGDNPSNPAAKGTVAFDFPVDDGVPAPVTAAAS